MSIHPHIREMAAEHADLIRHQALMDSGVSHGELAMWRKEGWCRPVIFGIYSFAPEPKLFEERLMETTRAMLLSNEQTAATGTSALVLHELPVFGVDDPQAQGVWMNGAPTRSTAAICVRRPMVPPDTTAVQGWKAVTPAWAVVELARRHGVVSGVVAADAALHRRLCDKAELRDVVRRLAGARGLKRAHRVAELANGASESPGESRLRLILEQAGFDIEPQYEVLVNGRVFARADFRVTGTRVLIEFDGLIKYAGADGKEQLAKEKEREDRLRALGWTIVRIVWNDLVNVRRIRSLVDAAILRAS